MSQWRNDSRDGVSCGGRHTNDGQNQEEPSSSSPCVTSREKRRRQRENRLKVKELSEEEMMDLALQLSQQEASVAVLQLQRREEEDVMKAIEESMILQARRPQSPYTDVEVPSRTCSRRKPSYSNGTVVVDEDDSSSSEIQLTSRHQGEQKRKPGICLQKKPDPVQTEELHLISDSPGIADVLDPILHSPQSSDSTLIDDSPRSPVFPSTCCQAEVVVPRLSQDLVQLCRTSGFVLCSQDSRMSSESLCDRAKSPTFPQSSRQSGFLSEKGQGDIGGLSPEPSRLTFSTQDSLSSSVMATSGRSPVFPRTGPSSSEMGQTDKSPVVQMTEALETSRSLNKTQVHAAALSPLHQTEDVGDSPGSVSGLEVTTNSDEAPLSSNMTLCWSDEDSEVTPVASPSPVFPAETDGQQAAPWPTRPNCRGERSIAQAQPISSQAAARGVGQPAPFGSTVHYYWGIPFCPRGLDPDRYTQVIVAQMEVFEKSLKMAQRNLLRKAEWGEGIQPQPEQEDSESECVFEESQDPRPQRRLRSKKRSDPADSPSARAEGDDNEVVEEVEQRESQQEGSTGVAEAGEDMETEDTEVPETQLSVDDEDERKEGLVVVRDIRAEQLKSKEPPDVQMILLESPPPEEEKEEEAMEEEAMEAEVRQTDRNSPEGRSSPGGPPPCDEEAERQDGASPSQEVVLDVQQASVDCPICQGSFSVGQIEMHAAYCDGAPVDSPPGGGVPVPVKPRRKRTRRCNAGDGTSGPAPSTSWGHMKCFICQSVVPMQDYGRHTDLCISRQDGASAAKENLLSALEKTDSRLSDVRPSGSRLQYSDVIDLRNDNDRVPVEEEEDGVGGVSSIAVSNSPIRSFTPISEATDCLIDFRKPQSSKKLGRRRR